MFLLRAWFAGPGSTAEDLGCWAALPTHLSHQFCTAQWDSDVGNPLKDFVPKELWHLFSFLCKPSTAELDYGGSFVLRKTKLLEIFQTCLQPFCSSWLYSFILQLGKTPWKFKKLPKGTRFTATVYQNMLAIAFQKRVSEGQESSEIRFPEKFWALSSFISIVRHMRKCCLPQVKD